MPGCARSAIDRWPRGRRSGLAAVVLLATATVACGGAADSSPSALGAEFTAKAVAVCQHALELKRAQGPFPLPDFNPTHPDASKFPEVAQFLRKTAVTFETWLGEMQALGEPPSGQAAWADLVDAIERHVELNADQVAAAERGDGETFTSDYHAGQQTQADLLRAAKAAGTPECAEVDR